MKNSIRFLTTVLLLVCCFVTNAQNKTAPTAKKLWTIEQVQEMAKKYNLQDSVLLPRKAFLVYLSKKNIDAHLQRMSASVKADKDWSEYFAKTKDVRTFDEDAKLVEVYPAVRAAIVKMRGGEQAHQKYKMSASKYKWRIYRDNNGALAMFRADQPVEAREFQYGVRVDNLQKQ
ncbi:MAG: hypothetical protein U5L45_00170 [Saprospiraceae bacterium]|nr:hypothetical protein [Saprospiraceae bacterium]